MGDDNIDVETIVLFLLRKKVARLEAELTQEATRRELAERELNARTNMYERAFLDLWNHPEFNRNLFSWVANLTPRGTQS